MRLPRGRTQLAGHADLATTQRYIHLGPAATEDAIRLLDGATVSARRPWHYDANGVGAILKGFIRKELVERATGIELC